jgi:hypothetical protein
VLNYVVRNRGRDTETLGVTLQRAREAPVPHVACIPVGAWRRDCGELSERTYAAALGRNAGVPRDRAMAQAELSARPEFRDDAVAAVYFAYDHVNMTPPQAAMGMLRDCIRLQGVELR